MDLQTQVMVITAVCAFAAIVIGAIGVGVYRNGK